MLPSWWRDTITVVEPGSVVERGTARPDWSTATRTRVDCCQMQPLAGDEQFTVLDGNGRRTAVVTRWKMFAPPAAPVTASCRVEHAGVTYELDGPPRNWPSASGALGHIEAVLQRVEG